LPALRTAIALPCVIRVKALLASFECRRRRKMGPLWQGERDQRCGYAMATAGATAPDVRWRPLF
jgi:hypothetical protein